MITAEISVVPIGTHSTSVSKFIAEAEKILKNFPDVKNKLTAMGTELECKDANELFDRHDKEASMEEKVESVLQKV